MLRQMCRFHRASASGVFAARFGRPDLANSGVTPALTHKLSTILHQTNIALAFVNFDSLIYRLQLGKLDRASVIPNPSGVLRLHVKSDNLACFARGSLSALNYV
jgi:hypothetical protein